MCRRKTKQTEDTNMWEKGTLLIDGTNEQEEEHTHESKLQRNSNDQKRAA